VKDRLRPNFVSLHCVSRLLHQAQDVGALGFLKVDVVLLRVFHTFSQVGRIDPPLLIRKLLLLTRGGLGDALLVAVPRVIIAESIGDLVPLVDHFVPVTKPLCPISIHRFHVGRLRGHFMVSAREVGQLRRLLVERIIFIHFIVMGLLLHQASSLLLWILDETGESSLEFRLNCSRRLESLDPIIYVNDVLRSFNVHAAVLLSQLGEVEKILAGSIQLRGKLNRQLLHARGRLERHRVQEVLKSLPSLRLLVLCRTVENILLHLERNLTAVEQLTDWDGTRVNPLILTRQIQELVYELRLRRPCIEIPLAFQLGFSGSEQRLLRSVSSSFGALLRISLRCRLRGKVDTFFSARGTQVVHQGVKSQADVLVVLGLA
jgi:hypothetical protein